MDKLKPYEILLEGRWNFVEGKIIRDEVSKRIEWLVAEVLRKIGVDESGWEYLYLDEEDGRQWILFYADSQRHGGGPPSLRLMNESERGKYQIVSKHT